MSGFEFLSDFDGEISSRVTEQDFFTPPKQKIANLSVIFDVHEDVVFLCLLGCGWDSERLTEALVASRDASLLDAGVDPSTARQAQGLTVAECDVCFAAPAAASRCRAGTCSAGSAGPRMFRTASGRRRPRCAACPTAARGRSSFATSSRCADRACATRSSRAWPRRAGPQVSSGGARTLTAASLSALTRSASVGRRAARAARACAGSAGRPPTRRWTADACGSGLRWRPGSAGFWSTRRHAGGAACTSRRTAAAIT